MQFSLPDDFRLNLLSFGKAAARRGSSSSRISAVGVLERTGGRAKNCSTGVQTVPRLVMLTSLLEPYIFTLDIRLAPL